MALRHYSVRRWVIVRALLLLAFVAAATAGDGPGASAKTIADAAAAQEAAQEFLLAGSGKWEAGRLRDLVRVVGTLPEAVAAEVVWTLAGAPARVDVIPVLAAAFSSPHPAIRCQVADVLVCLDTEDSRRLVMAGLGTEADPEVMAHIVNAKAATTLNRAVREMIDVMYVSGGKQPVVDAASEQLRRLTRANLPNVAADWDDWWLDNQHFYE
ncbi:MAG: HEAT repeat domain-containing protein [Planctomycetes bacterium]|nr:HEAT repeat domain-containing protein [Planctomycetota bacterium]